MDKPQVGHRLVALNCRYTHSCLALFYLRNAVEQNLPIVSVELLQLTINDPYYQTLLRISAGNPGVLFFSAYIWNGRYLRRLLQDLARLCPGKPMVIGGPQAEFLGPLPDECTLVLGEIEGLAPSFYQDLILGELKPLYVAEPKAEFSFPYHQQDFTSHLQNRQILYETSRGCPFTCSYCLSASSTRVMRKELHVVEQELQQILAAKPPLVKLVDRTFNDSPERALAIWKFLAECRMQTRFHFEVAPDRFTPEILDFLATVQPGLFQFEIGIQSTNATTLAAVNRKMDVERALAAIGRLAEQGNIHLHVDLILGLPEDNLQSFADSFRHVFSCRPHYIQMGLLKVLPGTPIAKEVETHGLLVCHEPPFEVLSTNTMDREELAELYLFGECVERFYNNRYFPSLYQHMVKNGEDPFAFFMGLLTLCIERDFFQRAATQELMTELLLEYTSGRADADLLRELFCYDWLRCGHRFLPGCLAVTSIADVRTKLRKSMPQELPPLYSSAERNRFFKQGIFNWFSVAALEKLGLHAEKGSAICFLVESEPGLQGWRQAVVLPASTREIP